jgi:hypothetical protein
MDYGEKKNNRGIIQNMVTLKSFQEKIRQKRAYPTPKRRPARLTSEVAKFQGHNRKKSKSR